MSLVLTATSSKEAEWCPNGSYWFNISSCVDLPGRVCMKAVTSSTLHWEGAGLNVVVGVEVVKAGADALLALRAARRSILAVMAAAGSSSPLSSSSSSPPSSMSSSSSSPAAFSFPSFSRRPALQRSRGYRESWGKRIELAQMFCRKSDIINNINNTDASLLQQHFTVVATWGGAAFNYRIYSNKSRSSNKSQVFNNGHPC